MNQDRASNPTFAFNESAPEADPAPRAAADGAALSVDEILEGIAEGFFALDANWRFIAFNRAAKRCSRLRRDEVVGKLLWEVSPGILGTEFDRRYRIVMSKREKQVFESYAVKRPDRYHEVRAFPLGDGIGVAFRDATDRQNILQKLRQRELELARVQEIGGIGGMRVDLGGEITAHRSPEYLRLHGLPPDAGVETLDDWARRIHPDDRSRTVDHFLRVVASGATQYKSEYRIVRPSDGEVRWIRAVGEIERDESAAPIALVGAHIDITDRKLAEQEALESEEKLRAIADALPVLISYVDKDQIFRFANKAYETWFERPLSAILGRRVDEVMSPAMYEARRPIFGARACRRERVVRGRFRPLDRRVGDASRSCPASRPVGPHSRRLCRRHRHLGSKGCRAKDRRKRGEVPLHSQQRAGADLGDRSRRQEGIRQPGLSRLYGTSYAEALAFDWRRALHPDDLARILAEEPVIGPSVRIVIVEARFLRSDGEWRWLRSESQPQVGACRRTCGLHRRGHDVTDAKRAQEELREINETLERRVEERTAQLAASEALVGSFFEHSSECHAILVEDDGGFRYQEVNPATLSLYGMARNEVVGRRTEDVLGPEMGAELNRHLAQCLREGGSSHYERMQGAGRDRGGRDRRSDARGGSAPRDCERARRHRAKASRGAPASIAKDGGAWPAHRGSGARFQQHVDIGARRARHHRPPTRPFARFSRDRADRARQGHGAPGRAARARADQPAACLFTPPGARPAARQRQ